MGAVSQSDTVSVLSLSHPTLSASNLGSPLRQLQSSLYPGAHLLEGLASCWSREQSPQHAITARQCPRTGRKSPSVCCLHVKLTSELKGSHAQTNLGHLPPMRGRGYGDDSRSHPQEHGSRPHDAYAHTSLPDLPESKPTASEKRSLPNSMRLRKGKTKC